MIKVENVSKWFGAKKAVNNVSFTVAKGEVLGFLGPNGAGKSTTMRMITGFIPTDEGRITINDHDIENEPIKAKSVMGYLPENAPSYGDMTVLAFLRFIASLRGLSGRERDIAVEKVIEMCFLEAVRYQAIDTLSKGYRHRTGFAQSIIHDPEVLIMDEPTDGLDPNQKHEIRNLIRRMSERKAIVLSTHILEEVDAVCARVIVINNGSLVANCLPSELRQQSKLARSVTVTVNKIRFGDAANRLGTVVGVDKVICLEEKDSGCRLRAYPRRDDGVNHDVATAIAKACFEAQWEISELNTEAGRLDEVFRAITTSDVDLKKHEQSRT